MAAPGPVDPPVDPAVPGTPPATKTIAEIQGTGAASPLAGSSVTTRGRVTATFPTGGLAGFYIQTPGTGGDLTPANHAASDAVFVYSPSTVDSVEIGDHVEVTGAVSEFFGMTQLTVAAAADLKKLTEAAPEVKATGFALPADEADRESLEGMLLTPQGPFTVTDNFSLNQYGEIGLAGGTTPLIQPTDVAPFGSRSTPPRPPPTPPAASSSTTAPPPTSSGRRHQGPAAAVPDHGGPGPRRRAGDVQDQRGAQLREQRLEVPAA